MSGHTDFWRNDWFTQTNQPTPGNKTFGADRCVGVDEMSVRKGHECISVFADLVARRVMFATEGKDKETWTQFVEALEKHNGHRPAITQVSMDMSPA